MATAPDPTAPDPTAPDQTAPASGGTRSTVVVVGLMATGKTTVGRRLAQRLGVAFHDSDAEIERGAAGRTVADLAHSEGFEAMHRREALQLLGHLGVGEPAVLAAAASVVDDPTCVDALRSDDVDVVWLRASVATMVARF